MLDAWLRKVPSVRIQGMHKNTLRPFGEGTVVHQQTNGVAIWLCWENYRQRHLFLGLSGPRLRRHLSKVSPPADGSPVCMNGQYATPPHHMHELQPGRPPPLRASEQRPKARQPHLDPVREASHAEREELLSSFGKYGAIHHHYGLSSPAEGISESGGALPTSAHHWCAFVSLL